MRLFVLTLLLAFVAILGGAAHQTWPDWWWHVRKPSPQVVFDRRIQPFLHLTCYECHDSTARKGDFALDRLSLPVPQGDSREAWERVLKHVSSSLMPPVGATQPSPSDRAEFISWLDRTLHPVDPRNPDPGRVVLRRLNREEYKNTVQDLFGITFNPAESFPEDDSGHGFDHIASVLTVSPLLFERYLAAAEQVAATVIPDPAPPPRIFTAPPEHWSGANSTGNEAALFSNTALSWTLTAPASGIYHLRLRVSQDAAGDEPARFAVRINGKTIRELPADGSRRRPRDHTIDLDLPAGSARIQIAFLNDFYAEATASTKARDRNFYLHDASVEGPYLPPGRKRPEGPLPAWIVPPRPEENRHDWYVRVLTPLVRRAWRRPPAPDEIVRLADLAQRSESAGDSPAAALQVALQAILTSPGFLFIGNPPPADHPVTKNQIQPLSDHALATRLAYFLWNGPPDEHLLDLADHDRLRPRLAVETARLLADPRARRFVQNFAGQWLEVRNLPLRTPDPKLYPGWSPDLAASMKEETLRFFADFLTNGRPITELLTADYTFVDARLARFYGLPEPAGDEGFQRVQRPADRRAGLLGQAGVLTVTSYPNRTSPVLRGKFVLEKILGTPPPPPPPNIPSLAEHAGGGQPQTLRGRLELHRSNPSCAACHALIDPIGFALEHYDALGRRRETDGGQPIDSSGQLVTGERVDSPVTLSTVLATARHDEFTRNFARTLLTYALGRGLDYYDRPTIDHIVTTAAARGHTLPAYIDAVVASIAFQNQRPDAPSAPSETSPVAFNLAP
ncbi:MAG: hypothetical protein K0R17_2321 [Rariglobus sp.]|jgi:hypothetical protein|nr:hypothetical protein [Rariglobus sp.]